MRPDSGLSIGSSRLVVALLIISFSTGCVEHTTYSYETHVFLLDEKNELAVSTFPSWFPETRSHIPFLYKRTHSPRGVYFEVFVREAGTTAGPNPNIESILIRSFSYESPGQPPVQLIEDFAGGFWQQGRAEHDSVGLEPVMSFEGGSVLVRFELLLNGRIFEGEQMLHAQESSHFRPLILDALR